MSEDHVHNFDFHDQCMDAAYFHPVRTNRSVRFGFSGFTVLSASRGDQVSCYTTVGGVGGSGVVLLKDIHATNL